MTAEMVSSKTTFALPVYAAMAMVEKGKGDCFEESVRAILRDRVLEG